jgi:hypothetical protein
VLLINVWPVGDRLFGAPSKSAPGARAPLAPSKGRPCLQTQTALVPFARVRAYKYPNILADASCLQEYINHRDKWRVKCCVVPCTWFTGAVNSSVCSDVECSDGNIVDYLKVLSRNLSGGTVNLTGVRTGMGTVHNVTASYSRHHYRQLTGFYGSSRYLCWGRKNPKDKHRGRYSMLLIYWTYSARC